MRLPRVPRRKWLLLSVVAAALVAARVGPHGFRSGTSGLEPIRQAVGRYAGGPAGVYPICVSRTDDRYAKAGVYPIPIRFSYPTQVMLRSTASGWNVIASQGYDDVGAERPLGWIADDGRNADARTIPSRVARERWCRTVPHRPASIEKALRTKRAVVSTFGLTGPYVPDGNGPPLYEPSDLIYSVDGGAEYHIDRWLTYGGPIARARVKWAHNPCRRAHGGCAGDLERIGVSFAMTLTEPRRCLDVTAYTVLTVSQSSNTRLLPNGSRSLLRFCTAPP